MSVTKPKPEQILHVRSMGKTLRVTAIAATFADAKAYMSKHPEEVVVAEFGELCFLANRYDPGLKVTVD